MFGRVEGEGEWEAMKIQFAIGKSTSLLKQNLEDFAWSLDTNLRRNNQGEAEGKFKGGFFVVTVLGSSVEIVQPYIDAFVHSMRKKHGQRFIVNLDETH